MIQHIVPIYFLRNGIQTVIEMVQEDSGREIIFAAQDIVLTSDMSAKIFVQKPSGLSSYRNAEVKENTVCTKATTQMLAEFGNCLGHVQLYQGNEKVTSFKFILKVHESRVNTTGIESKDEFTILEQTIKEAQVAINAANTARNAAEEAARKAESAAEAANTSSSNADTAAEKANTEAGKAVTAAGNANDAAALAAEKAGNAETAATNANAIYEKLKNMNVEQVNQDITDIKVAIAKTIMVEG